MNSSDQSLKELHDANARLRDRVEELENILNAIRTGEVDALVTAGTEGDRIFTLRGADQPYRILVEAMSEGAALLTSGAQILYCNSRLAAMLQTPVQRVTGRRFYDFIPPADMHECEDLMQRALEQPSACELWLSHGDGAPLPVLLSASKAVVDDEVCICLVATDLTARRRNEQVMASEKLARSILDQAPAAIVVCDEQGQIIRANQKAREQNGHLRTGEHLDTVLTVRLAGGARFSIASVLGGETWTSVEGSLDLAKGGGLPILLTAGPLTGVDGGVSGAVVTITDISERKRAEVKLREQAEALARSNADLERFAFAASHDLQEPLRMVTTYSQLLTRRFQSAGGPEAEMFASYVEKGALRMRTLVLDLLSYSRVIHDPHVEFSPVDMNNVVASALQDLEDLVAECRADIVTEVLPPVRGNAERIQQVITNLVSNAIRYAREPGVHIKLSSEPGADMHTFTVARQRSRGWPAVSRSHLRAFQTPSRVADTRERHGPRVVPPHRGIAWRQNLGGECAWPRGAVPVHFAGSTRHHG